MTDRPAFVLLEDGTWYAGTTARPIEAGYGEVVFTTNLSGYQEVFTDPSYLGQIVVMTAPMIGNYGVNPEDLESGKPQVAGVVVRELARRPSNWRATRSLDDWLAEYRIPVLENVDTRRLTRHIRERGAMNGIISSEITDIETLRQRLEATPPMAGLELSSLVTTTAPYEIGDPGAKRRIAVMDFGVKKNILRCFDQRDCYLKVFPARTRFEDVKAWNPDGYFLSNGPGDPSSMDYAVELARHMLADGKPLFGICLGQQLLALAAGLPTYKLHHGHRGINHPVKNLLTGRGEITSQNHGFGVLEQAVYDSPGIVEATHINLNDNTVEGIRLKDKPAFSVQYHPEAGPGPHDARYLFDQFVGMLS